MSTAVFFTIIVFVVLIGCMLHSLHMSDVRSGQYPPKRNPSTPRLADDFDFENLGIVSPLAQRLADSIKAGEWEIEHMLGTGGGFKFTSPKAPEYSLMYSAGYCGRIVTPSEWMSEADKKVVIDAMTEALHRFRIKIRDERAQKERDEIAAVLDGSAL